MPGQHLMSLEEEHVLELAFSQLVFLMELLFLHLPHCRLSCCTHQSTQQHGQCQFHNRTRHTETAHFCHGSPVSAISYSLVDRLTPIALSLTPGHAWHSSVASGTSGNWAFFVITCACRSCSILWQFQSHAVTKPGFLTAWMLVCLLVQSLLF